MRPHSLHLYLLIAALLFGIGGLPAGAQAARPAWDGASRFTILVMGMDRRPEMPATLAVRTDAMMLVSLDPQTSSVGILHIPRDLHFIPRWREDYVRANTLLLEGETNAPGSGPQFVMETLWFNLGIRIHSYAIFDFTAFVELVDAIGGIDVDVPYTINDPTFPDGGDGYEPLYIPAGLNHFDGQMALKYARTRHGDSDFERGERQMQIVAAIRDRVLSEGLAPRLIAQAPSLLEDLRDHVYTDLSLNEMLRLGLFAMSVPREDIRAGSINRDYGQKIRQPDGAVIWVVRPSRLNELMTGVFGPTYGGM